MLNQMASSRRTVWLLLALPLALSAAPAWPQEPAHPPPQAVEVALTAVSRHLVDQYALYLYESLTAQILYNENILDRPDAPNATQAKDSLWALGIISDSIMTDEEDGQYLDAEEIPTFFEDIVHRYTNGSHYWPDRAITKATRREHLAAWYSLYLVLLVANATQEEITAKLRSGAFNLDPGMLEASGPSLVDRLKKDGVLTDDAYALVKIQRQGQEDRESLTFPPYMDRWKARIEDAYRISPSP